MQQALGFESGLGLQIQFESQPDIELAFESLGNDTKHIELLSIKKDGDTTIANVFVPDGKLEHFEKLITDYLAEKKDKNGKPNDNKKLLNTISAIRSAELRALWTDDIDVLPQNNEESFWWEVWLTNPGHREAVVTDFRKLANTAGCIVSDTRVDFPERTVVLMYGSEQQLSQSVRALNCVAELRRAKETAELFDGMNNLEQQEWQANLHSRANFPSHNDNTPRVCLIDSGTNRGHALLASMISTTDLFTVNPKWGTDDESNHGTGIAGITTYGDLTEALSTSEPIHIDFLLESVKIIQKEGNNNGNSTFHANLFRDAVSQPEVIEPNRPRVFSSAVTASDFRDRGRPSSWSAMVDRLASDADGNGQFRRLIILSAGNIREQVAWVNYPDSLSTNLIHDPGQAWNAITVGAFTEKTDTQDSTLQAVATTGIEIAKWSVSNSLTLIVEDTIHPYKKEKGEKVKTRDMNLHSLPWPKEELEALGETLAQMRVTLSYFIEPNPSARGTTSKFHYPSCRLRFDVCRPLESTKDFLARVNAAAIIEEDEQQVNPKDLNWKLGEQNRH